MTTRSNIMGRFDRWFFDSYKLSAEQWGLFRIFYALFMLAVMGLPQLTYLAELPDMFFHPPRFSVGQFASGYPGYVFLKILGLLIAAAYLCILFGYRTRTASVAGAILAVFGKSFIYSTGQINHDFMVWMVPVAGAFANWGAAYSLDSQRETSVSKAEVQNWPIMILVIAFSFALALSGYHKYLGGWANPDMLAVNQWFIRNHIVVQREYLLGPYLLTFDNFLFWKSLDYLTLVFEIGIVVGIFYRRIFCFFLLITVGFHTANLLLLNIDFSFNLAFYALFLPWARIQIWLENKQNWHTALIRCLTYKSFLIGAAVFLLFFALTENAPLIFALNLVGIDYLGNAVVRTFTGVAVVIWLIYDFLVSAKRQPEVEDEKAINHDSQRLKIS